MFALYIAFVLLLRLCALLSHTSINETADHTSHKILLVVYRAKHLATACTHVARASPRSIPSSFPRFVYSVHGCTLQTCVFILCVARRYKHTCHTRLVRAFCRHAACMSHECRPEVSPQVPHILCTVCTVVQCIRRVTSLSFAAIQTHGSYNTTSSYSILPLCHAPRTLHERRPEVLVERIREVRRLDAVLVADVAEHWQLAGTHELVHSLRLQQMSVSKWVAPICTLNNE